MNNAIWQYYCNCWQYFPWWWQKIAIFCHFLKHWIYKNKKITKNIKQFHFYLFIWIFFYSCNKFSFLFVSLCFFFFSSTLIVSWFLFKCASTQWIKCCQYCNFIIIGSSISWVAFKLNVNIFHFFYIVFTQEFLHNFRVLAVF